ncbi:polysaccharide biosynthesis C-terminal domain-containing protein, partial [bacterium]|nr:polysaccharide biosynthesis C-terminal domain-containing protein [bacterium]
LFVFGISFSNLGMRFYGVREVVKDPANYGKVISELFVLGFMMKVFIFVIMACTIVLLGFSREKTLVCIIFLAAIFPDIIIAPTNIMFNAREKLGYPAVVDVITRSLFVIAAFLIIKFRESLLELAFSNFITYLCGSFILLYSSTKVFKFSGISFNMRNLYQRFKELLPFAIINVCGIIYVGIDILMLGIIRGDKAVGWYKIGVLIPQEGVFLLRFVSLALLPVMTRYYLVDKEKLTKYVEKLCKFYLILLLPISLLIMVNAKDILLLFFPFEFFGSYYALMILIWFLPLQYISSPFLIALQIAEKQVIITKISAILAFLNFILNVVFILAFGDDLVCVGPALGTLISSLVGVILTAMIYNKEIKKINFLLLFQKPVFSLIISAILFYLIHEFMNNVISSLIVFATYFLILRIQGEFSFNQVIEFIKDLRIKE